MIDDLLVGESHSRLLIDWSTSSSEGRDVVLRLVTAILAASSCYAQFPTQETISEMPFGFWYILQDDIIACEPEQYQKCVSLFGPVYTALVNAMLAKSMLDPKDNEWTADQREQQFNLQQKALREIALINSAGAAAEREAKRAIPLPTATSAEFSKEASR